MPYMYTVILTANNFQKEKKPVKKHQYDEQKCGSISVM